ncbi:Hypothetical protein SCF082_LOCUS29307 [Durusdinium trenchii]|uniref:Uncharacterized protein n=1 Tax=Durusdinium trenchii TaxID=1381693 RepID=A0ABP0MT51_9DINO
MMTRVVGPHADGKGKYWMIDGRDEEVPAGSVYRVTLHWGARLRVAWQREMSILSRGISTKELVGAEARHRYFVLGTWTSWTCFEMSPTEPNCFETTLRIGMSGMESFRFLRDQDEEQAIYPAKNALDADASQVFVRGPDELCNGKSWQITGKYGEQVSICLQIVDAIITVDVRSNMGSRWTATGVTGPARHSYWVMGSFNNWTQEQMICGERPGTFVYRGTAGPCTQQERFIVTVDEDPELVLYPDTPGGVPPGLAIVKGPARVQDDRDFLLTCLKEGAEFEIVLDFTARDKRKVVDVRWLTDPVDVPSMKRSFLNFFGSL